MGHFDEGAEGNNELPNEGKNAILFLSGKGVIS